MIDSGLNNVTISKGGAHRMNGDDTRQHVQMLESELNQLKLVTEALWEIVREDGKHIEAHLIRKMQRIEDGETRWIAPEGPGAGDCRGCGRALPANQVNCVYCGGDSFR